MDKRHDKKHMSVVFSTYYSIDVVSAAQRKHGLPGFDLVICDEAHRTTGATFEGEEESHFVRVHDDRHIKATKRLYMTATPRIYGEAAKTTAEAGGITLCSMNDESLYGKTLHELSFSDAVQKDLLTDYKVVVLAMDEAHVSRQLQSLLKGGDNNLKVDDASRIIGCWKALSKHRLEGEMDDRTPMRRAVAFCQVIERNPSAKAHKVSSKLIAGMFKKVVDAYQEEVEGNEEGGLKCEAVHVDGTMNASQKDEQLRWLRADPGEGMCHILTNVRCLSEGIDVPALDAVLFLPPRSSQVDVV